MIHLTFHIVAICCQVANVLSSSRLQRIRLSKAIVKLATSRLSCVMKHRNGGSEIACLGGKCSEILSMFGTPFTTRERQVFSPLAEVLQFEGYLVLAHVLWRSSQTTACTTNTKLDFKSLPPGL